MKKSDTTDRVAVRRGLRPPAAGNAVGPIFEAVGEPLLKGGEVRTVVSGRYRTRTAPTRAGNNPLTGASPEIEASTAPTFKPGEALKDAVTDRNAS